MEPQFNPAAEAQAIDRIHRLGQKRAVTTTRFIMTNSFEEKILKLQKKKTDLANLSMSQKLTRSELTKQKLEVSLLLLVPGLFLAVGWLTNAYIM